MAKKIIGNIATVLIVLFCLIFAVACNNPPQPHIFNPPVHPQEEEPETDFQRMAKTVAKFAEDLSTADFTLTYSITEDNVQWDFPFYSFNGKVQDSICTLQSFGGSYKEHYENSVFGYYSPTNCCFENRLTSDEYCLKNTEQRFISVVQDNYLFYTYGQVFDVEHAYDRNYYWDFSKENDFLEHYNKFLPENIKFYLHDLLVTTSGEVPFCIDKAEIEQNDSSILFSYVATLSQYASETEKYVVEGSIDTEQNTMNCTIKFVMTRENIVLSSYTKTITVENNYEPVCFTADQDELATYELSEDAKY